MAANGRLFFWLISKNFLFIGNMSRPLYSFISVHQLIQQYGIFVQILQIVQLFAKLSSVKSKVFSSAAFFTTVTLESSCLFWTLAAVQTNLIKKSPGLQGKSKILLVCENSLVLVITLSLELRLNFSDFLQKAVEILSVATNQNLSFARFLPESKSSDLIGLSPITVFAKN